MTDNNESAWQVVTSREQILEAGLRDVVIGRSVVLLIAQADQILAFQGLCPHQLARLSEGMLVGDALQCPQHLARFNLSDGACTGGWQLPPLKRYAVRIDGDQVLLPDPLVALT